MTYICEHELLNFFSLEVLFWISVVRVFSFSLSISLCVRVASGNIGCCVGLKCSGGSVQDLASNRGLANLLEHCLW